MKDYREDQRTSPEPPYVCPYAEASESGGKCTHNSGKNCKCLKNYDDEKDK